MIQKSDSVCADLDSGDDGGFVDIEELLSVMKQESINSSSMAKKVDMVLGQWNRISVLADRQRNS
jgi:hypothetical protein